MIWDKNHIDNVHVPSRDGLRHFWSTQASSVKNWDEMFDYDPFLGRLPVIESAEERQ
jgi:hypothetical protein